MSKFKTSGLEYTYFNSFSDVTIDLTPYLASIQTETGIDYKFSNIQPVKIPMVNFFDHTEIIRSSKILFFMVLMMRSGIVSLKVLSVILSDYSRKQTAIG